MSSKSESRKKFAKKRKKVATRSRTKASSSEIRKFLTLYNARDFFAAQTYARSLADNYPRDAFGWKVLGSCLHKNGEIPASHDALEKSLTLNPLDAQAQHLMARALYDMGKPTEAMEHARRAVELESTFAQGHYTLAEILTEADRDSEALEALSRAESLHYEDLQCLYLRFQILIKRRHFGDAEAVVPELLKKAPENHTIHNGIGNLYKDLGRYEDAQAAYRRALELKPDFDMAFSNLVIGMHYDPTVSAEQIRATIHEWDEHFPDEAATYSHSPKASDAEKTIRIGLVSSGFRRHPVGEMSVSGLENIGPGFELYFYSTNNADDPLTRRLKGVATRWNLVRHLSHTDLADQIYQDGIDVLFDLSGFGDGNRIRTMRKKPAPLIVKWVGGLINTMGLECYDYLLTDAYETPAGSDEWYTEKLIRMPDDYICYLPAPDAPSITALPALTNGYITLGCFNNPAKLNSVLLAEWAKLMHELPDSRLFLKGGPYESEEYCERIRRTMSDHGIEHERLIIEGPSIHEELLAAYNRVDIALDPWPYSGGLTTCEAFMMGVPVVTMPGDTFAGRHSATHLINAGMPELVTDNWSDYRAKVLELASDIPNLSIIRACLRQFLIQSPVCDAKKFAANFSTAIRAIWQRSCESKRPEGLTLSQQGTARFADEQHDVNLLTEHTAGCVQSPASEHDAGMPSAEDAASIDTPAVLLPIQNTAPDHNDAPQQNESEFRRILKSAQKNEINALAELLSPFLADLELRQPRVWGDKSRLHIDKATISLNDLLVNTRSGHVTINEDCFFGHRCMLLTGTHDYSQTGIDRLKAVPDSGRDIYLERGVWLGSGVTVLGPVHIAENAVIAAGSLVTKNVPANTIVAGRPAAPVRKTDGSSL